MILGTRFALTIAMDVRKATDQDVGAMVKLLKQLFALEPDFAFDPIRHERGLGLLLENSQCRIWTAFVDGISEAVGMITLQPHISTGFGCIDGLVEDFVVHEDFRGKGIGTKLFDTMMSGAKEMGYSRLRLLADIRNRQAHQFYGQRGWDIGQMVPFYCQL